MSSDRTIKFSWPDRGRIGIDAIEPVILKEVITKSVGHNSGNLVIQGDNVSVMKTLCVGFHRLKGEVDLLLWDPPYNTGNKDFAYEDDYYLSKKEVAELESDSDDRWVKEQDASRHTKWLDFMEDRLRLGKRLLKESGVAAIHIGPQIPPITCSSTPRMRTKHTKASCPAPRKWTPATKT